VIVAFETIESFHHHLPHQPHLLQVRSHLIFRLQYYQGLIIDSFSIFSFFSHHFTRVNFIGIKIKWAGSMVVGWVAGRAAVRYSLKGRLYLVSR
jgi:hypothetical protein